MFRLWYIGGFVVLLAILYQGFFRYDYTMVNGYAVSRYDRLTGNTCGIPQCLPPTPTPVPKPTVFDPVVSYHEEQLLFAHYARLAVKMVEKTEFGEELMHSPGAKRYSWTCEWANQVAGSVFTLHDPRSEHPLPVTPQYIDSLKDPSYRVELVCFCDQTGSGYRWQVDLNTKTITYVNDDPKLEKQYGLTETK